MLNWDEPLTPQVSRPPEPAIEAPALHAEPALKPVAREEKSVDVVSKPAVMPTAAKPINPEDKRVVNGHADINQLAPFKYPWAWDYFLNANKNHWTPLDINMTQDVHD